MDIIENEKNVQYFLDLIKKSRRGKFKLYIGMIAGVEFKLIECYKKPTNS